jgi:hypothetical protein
MSTSVIFIIVTLFRGSSVDFSQKIQEGRQRAGRRNRVRVGKRETAQAMNLGGKVGRRVEFGGWHV